MTEDAAPEVRDDAVGPGAAEAGTEDAPRPRDDAPRADPPPPGERGGRRSSPLGLLAFLGVIALGLSVYLLWQRIDIMTAERDAEVAAMETMEGAARASLDALADEIERLEAAMVRGADPSEAIAALRAGIESRLDAIESRLAGAESRSEGTDSALEAARAEFADAVGGLRAEFGAAIERLARPAAGPADVERLLLTANDALILQRDIGTALEALRTADARLHRLDDPAYAETRRRIATEIAALEASPRADVQGMAFALGGLQRELRALSPRLEPVITRGAGAGDPGAADGERTWRTFLGDLWGSLRGLVVIRRTEDQEGPLMAPEAQVFLAQNLYLELETARLALLERDQANFRQGLETARDWLVTYYDAAAPRVAGLVGRLDELARVELDPDLPDISGSLETLREVMEERRAARRQATPPPPPAPAGAPDGDDPDAAGTTPGDDGTDAGPADGATGSGGAGGDEAPGSVPAEGEGATGEVTGGEAAADEAAADAAIPGAVSDGDAPDDGAADGAAGATTGDPADDPVTDEGGEAAP